MFFSSSSSVDEVECCEKAFRGTREKMRESEAAAMLAMAFT